MKKNKQIKGGSKMGISKKTIHWLRGAVALFVVMLFTSSQLALAATPAGTVIGNVATATYYDANNNKYSTTSNVVQTTVTEVCGVDVTPEAGVTKTGVPGQTVYLAFTVSNTGNGENTYNLTDTATYSTTYYLDSNSNGIPDSGETTTTTATLSIGATASIVAAVVIPPTAISGDSDIFNLSATGTAPAGCNDLEAGTVNVTTDAIITANKSVDKLTATVGDTLTYTVGFQNTGLSAVKAEDGFSLDLDTSGTIASPAEDATIEGVLVYDALPTDTELVTGTASGTPASNPTGFVVYSADGTDWYRTEAHAGGVAAITHVGYFMTDATADDNVLGDVLDPDQQGSFTFQVTIDDPFTDGDNSVDNSAVIYYTNTGGSQTTTTNTVSTSLPVSATADISIGGLDGWSYAGGWTTAATFATAEEDGTYTDDNYVTNAPAAGSWIIFQHRAKNNGSADDVINIAYESGDSSLPAGAIVEMWNSDTTAKLIDSDQNGTIDVGNVASTSTKDFTVKIYIPGSTAAVAYDGVVDYYATIRAHSSNNNAEVDRTRDNIDGIIAAAIDMAQNPEAADNVAGDDNIGVAIAVDPGSTATYSIDIANTGGASDSYDLSVASLPAATTAQFYSDPNCDGSSADGSGITNTGLLGASSIRANDANCTGSNTIKCLYEISNLTSGDEIVIGLNGTKVVISNVDVINKTITVPDTSSTEATGTKISEVMCAVLDLNTTGTTPAITDDSVTLTATSPTSTVTDNMTLLFTVNQVCSVSVAPSGNDQLPAGGTTTYTHTITNKSNYAISPTVSIVELSSSLKLSYTIVADTDSDGTTEIYAPNTGFTIALPIAGTFDFQIAVQAPPSLAPGNIESITIEGDATSCSAQGIDTTTVIDGFLQLTKSATVATAAPGETIGYKVQYQNIGTADAEKVVITDNIPSYTTYLPASLCLDTDCNDVCDSTPTDASDGDTAEFDSTNSLVRFRVGTGADATNGGTVIGGTTQCVYFEVTVD